MRKQKKKEAKENNCILETENIQLKKEVETLQKQILMLNNK